MWWACVNLNVYGPPFRAPARLVRPMKMGGGGGGYTGPVAL